MLEAIDHKLADAVRHDDLHWPLLEPHPSVNSQDAELVTKYWTALRDRYRSEAAEASLTDRSLSSLLPQHWTTISIHLSPERDCLLLVRHRREVEPVVFKLPLDRLARREGEEESFTYDLALEELQDIITANNAAAQHAKHVTGKEERAEWWAERKDLDGRLKTLVQTIEDDWLGAFKVRSSLSRNEPNLMTLSCSPSSATCELPSRPSSSPASRLASRGFSSGASVARLRIARPVASSWTIPFSLAWLRFLPAHARRILRTCTTS